MRMTQPNFKKFWHSYQRGQVRMGSAGEHNDSSLASDIPKVDPVPSIATDPTLSWARAEERFAQFQLRSGNEILQGIRAAETAADEQNQRVAENNQSATTQESTFSKPAPIMPDRLNPIGRSRFQEPHNDPLSSIPGGPFGPPGGVPGA